MSQPQMLSTTSSIVPNFMGKNFSNKYLDENFMKNTNNLFIYFRDKTVDANIEGIEVADGARLIMDEYNQAGVAEFARAFLASSGVDPRLVPESWIDNHYRLIVWKLASYDRVTFENVAMQRFLFVCFY